MSNINVVCLGGASEVGRSCVIIESEKTSIMLDCGIHPAFMGIGCLPIYDAYDISKIDLCLITHFHMDHSGALPYLVNRTRFRGRVFMTEATKSICYLLWNDYARIEKCMNIVNKNKNSRNKKEFDGNISDGIEQNMYRSNILRNEDYGDDEDNDEDYYDSYICESYNESGDRKGNVLYDEEDIDKTMELIETLNFHENLEFPNVKITAYRAGHVIGACMFLVEVNNVRLLYTGDYSREVDRHIPIAEIPNIDVHVLICEGTYGIKVHDNRKKREIIFLNMLTSILNNKGKVLLPVFALGRAQELLLILEEHWHKNISLQKIPIFYISSMATKSLCIYETYINLCGDFVKKVVNEGKNPFHFKYIKYAKTLDSILSYIYQDNNPCVIMASPGMLQNGISKNIFNIIAPDKKSGVIITGYTVKGTLADELKTEPEFVMINDKLVKRKCRFEQISFSAHSDFNQTKTFIEKLKCPNVVLVHGDRNELNRLKNKLVEEKKYLSVFTPELLQKVSFHFEQNDYLVSLGKLAKRIKKINKKIEKKKKKNGEVVKVRNDSKVGEEEAMSLSYGKNELTDEKQKLGDNNHHKENVTKMERKSVSDNVQGNEEIKRTNYYNKDVNDEAEEIEAVIISESMDVPIIIYPNDIYNYTNLKTALIDQTINIKFPYKFELLYNLFCNVYEETSLHDNVILVKDVKIIYCKMEKIVKINWLSSPVNDLIADSINFLILECLDSIISCGKNFPISNHVTEKNVYQMIVSFVEENYTKVERISKREIKWFILHNRNAKNNDFSKSPIDAEEQDEKKKTAILDNPHIKNDSPSGPTCDNYDDNDKENCYASYRTKAIKFHEYDSLLMDYIEKNMNWDPAEGDDKRENFYEEDEIGEILKFEVRNNSNNDVQVFVDIDNREVICKEEYILLKIKEIMRNIEESLLPMALIICSHSVTHVFVYTPCGESVCFVGHTCKASSRLGIDQGYRKGVYVRTHDELGEIKKGAAQILIRQSGGTHNHEDKLERIFVYGLRE
ncbi:cleavage and polyadenylation specificity factor, putative [Plasmodium ovale curtisi]|uniref:Cleavage and polyadenylation specificity factor, putative n=1 Tax=Plasmodium ovale curtisi TaxID=864141 RepID=A0A1A8W1V7_PLAOA|nr:cleavage and polyadenylation specificity factor, putative [Plasmodium ovale curtisi]